MTTITVAKAQKDFAGTLRHVTADHESVVLRRGRKIVALLIPPELEEMLEDLEDIRDADKAMAEYEKDPSSAIPYNEFRRKIGLRK